MIPSGNWKKELRKKHREKLQKKVDGLRIDKDLFSEKQM
jgi:hypothetical protein